MMFWMGYYTETLLCIESRKGWIYFENPPRNISPQLMLSLQLKGNKWEIKDSELKAELKDGAVLMAYSSTDSTEPVV